MCVVNLSGEWKVLAYSINLANKNTNKQQQLNNFKYGLHLESIKTELRGKWHRRQTLDNAQMNQSHTIHLSRFFWYNLLVSSCCCCCCSTNCVREISNSCFYRTSTDTAFIGTNHSYLNLWKSYNDNKMSIHTLVIHTILNDMTGHFCVVE